MGTGELLPTKKDYEVLLAEVQQISLDYGAVIGLAEGMGLPDSQLGRMETVSATLDAVTKWITEWKDQSCQDTTFMTTR